VTIRDFDPANYLDSDEMIVEYFKATAKYPNPEVFLGALDDVTKANDMAEIAKKQDFAGKAYTKPCLLKRIRDMKP
jgi:DNA-binding phage protein